MVSILSGVEPITLEYGLEAKNFGRDAVTPFRSMKNNNILSATEEEHDEVRVDLRKRTWLLGGKLWRWFHSKGIYKVFVSGNDRPRSRRRWATVKIGQR